MSGATAGGRGPILLGIDTAAPEVGAALWLGDGPGPAWSARAVRGADAVLLPAVQELLAWLDTQGLALNAVAVTVGPGAFTGLRVGVATALGLAVARSLPVVPVDALAARAGMAWDAPVVLALLDARKGRVYAGTFAVEGGLPAPLSPPGDLELADALPRAPFLAVGEGARTFAATLLAAGGTMHPQATACPAPAVARLGALLPRLDAGAVALHYLRGADAIPPADLGRRVGQPDPE